MAPPPPTASLAAAASVLSARRDGRRDAQGVDAADAEPRYEEAGQGEGAPGREPEQREPDERQAEGRGEESRRGQHAASRLLAIRPTSIAAKKAVREVAAAGRVRPVPSARKSAPQ